MKDMNPEQIAQYKSILLNTFVAFTKFCKQHDLKYFGAYGTVIGAVRHHGLIPWDDDIDVYMKRADYERFKSLKQEALNCGYRIEGYETPGYTAMFSKFVDGATTLWETESNPYTTGVYIDVFPLDFTSESGFSSKYKSLGRKFFPYLRLRNKTVNSDFLSAIKNRDKILLTSVVRGLLCESWNYKKIYNSFFKIEKSLSGNKGDKLASFLGPYGMRELYEAEWFDDCIEVPFENSTIAIPKGYDAYLRQLYGDYMKLPPVEKQKSHHFHYYVNFDKYLTVEEVLQSK